METLAEASLQDMFDKFHLSWWEMRIDNMVTYLKDYCNKTGANDALFVRRKKVIPHSDKDCNDVWCMGHQLQI